MYKGYLEIELLQLATSDANDVGEEGLVCTLGFWLHEKVCHGARNTNWK